MDECKQPVVEPKVGDRLRFWRSRSGLTVTACARLANVNQSLLSRYELNKLEPKFEVLDRLIAVCGVDLVTFWGPLPTDDTTTPQATAAQG